jgi:two-component system NarL family response regulator
MRILVVDDHNLFREGLVGLLSGYPDLTVVGEAGTARGAIEKAVELNPDLILLDISLPDRSGIDALIDILALRPEIKIIMLTIHETDNLLLDAIRNGAAGYLLKNTPINKLLVILRGLENGEAALSLTMTGRIVKEFQRNNKPSGFGRDSMNTLTARELEILDFLMTGATNQDIAERLVLSENTVKVHIHNILEKLNLRNRHEATKYAQRYQIGLVPSASPSQSNK